MQGELAGGRTAPGSMGVMCESLLSQVWLGDCGSAVFVPSTPLLYSMVPRDGTRVEFSRDGFQAGLRGGDRGGRDRGCARRIASHEPEPGKPPAMNTRVLTVDSEQPESRNIELAAEALRLGELVAFPTETVYGLGANALDGAAVARIFEAKGPAFHKSGHRPRGRQGGCAEAGRRVARAGGDAGRTMLAGPPDAGAAEAGGHPGHRDRRRPNRRNRVPAHPIALALLRAARIPIAAPSANRSTEVSPTTAAHVLKGLDGRIAMVLDGGPTTGGIELRVPISRPGRRDSCAPA